MKKTDIAMIILIASVSVMGSYFLAKAVLGDPQKKETTVKVADRLESEVAEPSAAVFNDKAINPTVQVVIGGKDEITDSSQKIESIARPVEQN